MVSTNSFVAPFAQAWPVRFLRSLATSGLGLVLALGGHRAGGGEIAPVGVIALAFGIGLVVALSLSARQLTAGQILGLLLIVQVVVHVSCAFGASVGSLSPGMILGHVLATALTAGVLLRGERYLWTLADRLFLRSLRLFLTTAGVVATTPHPGFRRRAVRLPLRLVLIGGNGLRGPPVGCA